MTVTYEVYTLVNGRWQIHVRYEEGRREEAITEAQVLEKESHIERTRVVRDQYDALTNASRETTVYETVLGGDADKKRGDGARGESSVANLDNKAKTKGQVQSQAQSEPTKAEAKKVRRAQAIGSQPSKEPSAMAVATESVGASAAATVSRARQMIGRRPNQEEVARRMLQLAVAISVSTLVSIGVAIAVWFGLDGIHKSGFYVFQSQNTFMGLVIAAFVLAFAQTFIPMMRKIKFTNVGAGAHLAATRRSAQLAPKPIQQVPQIHAALNSDTTLFDDDEDQIQQNKELDPETKKQEIVERTKDGPQHLQDASGWMLSCMNAGLETIPEQMTGLGAFNRFGLTLFFAGAGDFVGTRYRCDQTQRSDMLTERMQLLGHDENTAFAFCANIDEYLMQPKYLKMYDLGRTAMKNYLENQGADLKIEGALKDWNKPAATAEEEAASDFVVVLFTDIVNSTAQTQEIGDEGAMEVVRAHNQIVREALVLYRGTEVKHMGDGIMAVFQSVPDSVQAAIHMQNAIEAYCQTAPDRQFRCRIGINAGEPIREGQDFFGTPVQLAARVMSKAESDEIAVSHIVQTMYTGKDINFKNVGSFDLKGFDEPMAIFHVIYRPNQMVAAE
tara:strand:+ start:149 stop:1996 length:1848 start_codon:yes stop_codon:yes gene_type:complete